MSDPTKKYFCPRLLDYVICVGPRTSDMGEGQTSPSLGGHSRVPHLLRRYPAQDHQDFALPPDVVIFCQPEGCERLESTLGAYNNPSHSTNSFVFLLTEKDTSRVRYGICLNYYRPLQKCPQRRRSSTAAAATCEPATNVVGCGWPGGGQDNQSLGSTQDNESGIKTGLDSDSVGSSGHHQHHHHHQNKQSGTDSVISSQSALSRNTNNNNEPTEATTRARKHKHHHHHHHHHHTTRQQQQQQQQQQGGNKFVQPKEKSKITYALNSICIISHHPFFSTFRECLFIMKKFIQACEDRNLNLTTNKDNQPRCKCYLKQIHGRGGRRGSLQSHFSQASRRSVTNCHLPNCPYYNPIWSLLTMPDLDENSVPASALADVAEIEAWILRLLSVPVPVPEKTKIEVEVTPISLKQPLLFALPDHTRFSLIDFPLHLPLELLGVQTCLQVLTCILLEHKVALQSKDYNALSMSVMAFVTMIYPLEYMFPVIPLLPSCMSSAEQLLLAPTPFIIGFPSSFFKFKNNFTLPNDVWIVDLDANKVKKPPNVEDLPPLPDYEGSILVQNLQKILDSMSGVLDQPPPPPPPPPQASTTTTYNVTSAQLQQQQLSKPPPIAQKLANPKMIEGQTSMPSSPYKRRSSMAAAGQLLQFAANKLSGSTVNTSSINNSPISSARTSIAMPITPAFDPLTLINKDTDAVDVAVRIAMVRFFNSQEVLANFIEHTRTIRLYPRPVVSFQKSSFIQSRAKVSPFLLKLVESQAVEYMAEWALCPDNVAFQRIQTGVYDPAVIGDKPKWYGNQLKPLRYQIWDGENKEFYEEIVSLIRDSSSVSGAASSTGKFSDYYDDTADKANLEHSDLDEDDLVDGGVGKDPIAYDLNNNNNMLDDDSHSTYMSSNDSSPCLSSDKETDARALTLNDVMNLRLRKSSISSSISSTGSWSNDQVMQSIPANYQHDIGRFPPIRCDVSKCFKPSNTLVYSLDEPQKASELGETKKASMLELEKKVSIDSSDDENDSSKVIPDSSSCDESGTEELNFASLNPKPLDTPTNDDEDEVVKLFESVDSDTITPSHHAQNNSDENNNQSPSSGHARNFSINNSIDSLSINSSALEQTNENEDSQSKFSATNKQKLRLNSGVAKLIDSCASSIDSKLMKQGSTSSSQQSPKTIVGEQMGAFFDRVTFEARDAVKEAKAALDAGKNALKTTALPAADAGRQKLLKNFHNIGEAFLENRRDSVVTKESMDETSMRQESDGPRENQMQSTPSRGSDLNGLASKANNTLSGWLGSKATGLANRMRDRTRQVGAFPSIDLPDAPTIPSPPPPINPLIARRSSLVTFRRSSIACQPVTPRLHLMRNSALNQTIDESDIFVGQKLVQKTHLIRHSTALNDQPEKPQPIRATQSDSDNQQFLKEITAAVMKGEGIGWMKLNRVKKLMEDESYRDLVVSRINKKMEARIRPDDRISDIQVSKNVWRGMIKICSAIVSGLEQSYMHNKLVGMASVFSLLEVCHTHYWTRRPGLDNDGDQIISNKKPVADSSLNLEPQTATNFERERENSLASSSGGEATELNNNDKMEQETSDSIDNSNTQARINDEQDEERGSSQAETQDQNNISLHSDTSSSVSDSRRSTLASHQGDGSSSPSQQQVWNPKQGFPQMNQATLSSGVALASLNEDHRVYLYEGLLQKDRSPLWDQVQFWEEAFLDAVSHERCLTGMDQGPGEMLERYKLLYEMDKKRLEHEEDRLLSSLLYNMTAFMLMLQVDKHSIKQKIRRLLGKCHIGLVNSAEINQLLEQIESLKGNDIDLKPMASKQVRRQTFTLHQGTDASGSIVFMEIRDDGLVIRGLDGVIMERWWYERLINVTYSPKNKIICFWRKSEGETKLYKYYTRKCQDLYHCIKESMQRAATNYGANRVCSELGGEFPVLDVKSGEGAILQVCMEGVGLLFSTSKCFVRLENIRRCFTQKGGTFVLEEYNPKSRQLIQRHFKSQMADQICYAVLCVFSYYTTGPTSALTSAKAPASALAPESATTTTTTTAESS